MNEKETFIEEYLTATELAEIFKVKKTTIYVWKDKEGLPHLKVGGTIRFPKQEVIQWAHTRIKGTCTAQEQN